MPRSITKKFVKIFFMAAQNKGLYHRKNLRHENLQLYSI